MWHECLQLECGGCKKNRPQRVREKTSGIGLDVGKRAKSAPRHYIPIKRQFEWREISAVLRMRAKLKNIGRGRAVRARHLSIWFEESAMRTKCWVTVSKIWV